MAEKVYMKPMPLRLERQERTEELYRLEHQRNEAIIGAAREWAKYMGVQKKEFWTRALPQQLFDLLDSFEHGASRMAAEAYLELHKQRYGY